MQRPDRDRRAPARAPSAARRGPAVPEHEHRGDAPMSPTPLPADRSIVARQDHEQHAERQHRRDRELDASSDRLRADRNTGCCTRRTRRCRAARSASRSRALRARAARHARPCGAGTAQRGRQQPLLRRLVAREHRRRLRPRAASRSDRSCPSSSGSSLETSTTRLPSAREAIDQLVDFELGADVDAARRLVEQQHLRLGQQRLAEHDLLLVAAGQRAAGPRAESLDAQLAWIFAAAPSSSVASDDGPEHAPP